MNIIIKWNMFKKYTLQQFKEVKLKLGMGIDRQTYQPLILHNINIA
jgi:hypothetical protein